MPSVAANGDSNSFASEWIGIDGDGCNRPFNNDLLQIGTETDVASGSPSQPYAWVEYLPFNPTQLPLTDWITISAGDEVQAQMFLGNSSGDPEQNGTYAFFYFEILSPTSASTGLALRIGVQRAHQFR